MISPSMWEDPSFNKLTIGARLLFIGMISSADDEGYLRGDLGSLKRLIFGFDEKISEELSNWIKELKSFKNVHFFETDDEVYAHLLNWDKYQKQQVDRISPTIYPKCPTCHITTTIVLNNVKDDKDVSGNLPLRIQVSLRDKMCRYCGIRFPSGGISFILEHIIPKALGGTTDIDNCVLACQSCNTKKGRRTPESAGMKLLPLNNDCIQDVSIMDTKVSKVSKKVSSNDIFKKMKEVRDNLKKNKTI